MIPIVLALSPITLGILVALLAVIGYLIYQFMKRRSAGESPPPEASLADLGIADARKGDTVSVLGRGDDYDDLDFTVDRRNRYVRGGEESFELSGRYRNRRVFVEWSDTDELEVSATLQTCELTLADLGLGEDDLIRMDESQDRSEGFEYDGARFDYSGSQEIGYFRDGQGEGEGYYCWEFTERDGDRILSIEKWEGEPFEVGIAVRIPPGDIRVFRP